MNNDLISREALKKAIDLEFEKADLSEYEACICVTSIYDKCIDNAPTVEYPFYAEAYQTGFEEGKNERPKGEWIPVSEKLPDDMQRVLIWFEYYRYGDFNCMYQTYGFGYVCDGKWSPFINGETGWQDAHVIAWQPLPEPYEKGGEE